MVKTIVVPILILMCTFSAINVTQVKTDVIAVHMVSAYGYTDATWDSVYDRPTVKRNQPVTDFDFPKGKFPTMIRGTVNNTPFTVSLGQDEMVLHYNRGTVIFHGAYRDPEEAIGLMRIWLEDMTDSE